MDKATTWLLRGAAVAVIAVGGTGVVTMLKVLDSSQSTAENKVSVDIDKIRTTGNVCPSGWAYMGGGYCQEVKCVMDSFGSNHPAVAGKGWVCPKKPLFGRGFSTLGSASVRSTTSEKCPQVEPEVGTISKRDCPVA